jgi:hypothetical protein
LSQNLPPNPNLSATATGGRKIARRISRTPIPIVVFFLKYTIQKFIGWGKIKGNTSHWYSSYFGHKIY